MFRPTVFLIALLVVSLSLTLFVVKYQVQDLEEQLVGLNRSITDDRQAIHVLKAEWSHLNETTRLRGLAERHLGLGAIEPNQVGTASEMLSDDPQPPERATAAEPVRVTIPAIGEVAPLPVALPASTATKEIQR